MTSDVWLHEVGHLERMPLENMKLTKPRLIAMCAPHLDWVLQKEASPLIDLLIGAFDVHRVESDDRH